MTDYKRFISMLDGVVKFEVMPVKFGDSEVDVWIENESACCIFSFSVDENEKLMGIELTSKHYDY